MRTGLALRRIADDVFEIATSDAAAAQSLAETLRADAHAEDVVAGLRSVAVRFDPALASSVRDWLVGSAATPKLETQAPSLIEIEILYGGESGPDLDRVCDQLNISRTTFIDRHSSLEHTVEMIGFTPGFSYISGIPDSWSISRLDTPRRQVAAGSVGISAGYTGTYALDGPGGWPLIGRTTARLFDASSTNPVLLAPRQRVKFKPV